MYCRDFTGKNNFFISGGWERREGRKKGELRQNALCRGLSGAGLFEDLLVKGGGHGIGFCF
jgi:hypothetical protein